MEYLNNSDFLANPIKAKDRKFVLEEEKYNATNFMTLWEFDGVLKYSPLFYGWYANTSSGGYKVPLAYFLTGLFVYGYSFFATLRKMAENSRTSKLSEKDDELIFTWKVFTAWDYMIGNAETAHNRVSSIIMGFKEALLEEAEKKKDIRSWRVTSIRVLVNVVVIALLALSMYVVVLVVKRSTEPEAESSFWRKNEIAIVMSLITFVFPMVFEVLGLFEQYHPRKQLRLQLGRIMVLNLVNLYSLIFALIDKIGDMTTELQTFKNITNMINDSLSLSTSTSSSEFVITMECLCNSNKESLLARSQVLEPEVLFLNSHLSGLVSNITNLMMTNITATFNESLSDINFLNTSLSNFVNSVIQQKIIGNLSSTLFENITIPTFQELNFTDIEYKFADYLTYLLFSLQDSTANTTLTYDNSTDLNDNITVTTWDEFSSTIFPLLNNTDSSTDVGRFDYDFSPSTIFDFTSTTLQEETSTDPPECKKFCEQSNRTVENVEQGMNYTMKARFRNLCWETMFGQELISITIMDLIMTIVPSLGMDFFRGIFVRVMNRCWCWDLEKKFPKYGDFKVAENILSLVNNQGMVWMGMFFCPGLVLLNVIKLYITIYFKSWTVMTCNVPPEVIFRASRSNNFYYYLLLMMLFLCVLPVGYTIVWIKPSWHCGPFSKYPRIFHIFTKTIKDNVPDLLQRVLEYIASPGIVIPLLVLLILIIYYLLSLTNSLREANEELKIQLRRERTEERRKMFQLADRRRRGGSGESNELANTPFTKWKKLIGNLPSGKSLDDTPKQEADDAQNNNERIENRGKDFFSKLIKKALRKSSTSEDEMNAEDGTDTEQHDSLPHDSLAIKSSREVKPSFSWGTTDFQNIARKALQLKAKPDVQQIKSSEIIAEPKHVQIDHKAIIKLQKSDAEKKITDIKEAVHESKLQERDKQKLEFVKDIPVEQISSTKKEEPHKIVSRRRSHTKTTIPTIEEVQITNEASTSNNIVTRNSDISINKPIKEVISEASTSTSTRRDSESSIWSDGIPVIKISKTDSSENILHACDEPWAEDEDDEAVPKRTEDEETKNFKPRIRSALRKQSSIDEDTIRYFNDDLEKNILMVNTIKAVAEENVSEEYEKWLSPDDDSKGDEALTDKSSSEDTDHKDCSTDTILRSPKENDSH